MKTARPNPSRKLREAFRLEPLEPRVLLSADPVLGAAQVALRPADEATQALIDAYTASADLVVQTPANATVLLTNGPAKDARPGWLVIDTSQLNGGNGTLVIGGPDGNAKILIGEEGGAAIHLANLVILNPQAGGEIVHNVALDVSGGILVQGSGQTTALSSDVNNGTTTYLLSDSISVSNGRTVTVNAGASLGLDGGFIGGDGTGVNDDTLTVLASGNVRFRSDIGQNLDLSAGDSSLLGGLTVDAYSSGGTTDLPDSVTFDHTVRIAGDLVIRVQAGGTVTFSDTLELLNGGSLQIYGAQSVQFASGVKLSGLKAGVAGNILVEGNVIDLPSTSSSVEGQGSITLRPSTKAANIEVGLPAFDPSALSLPVNELKALKDGFSTVVIGWQSGAHADAAAGAVRVGGNSNSVLFRDNVEIYGQSILVEDSSLSGTYLQVSGSIKLDAVQDITILNRVFALGPAQTGVSDINLYSQSGGIVQRDAVDPSENDGTTGAAVSEVLRGATLTARAATGILLPFTDVVAVNATNTTSGNIAITELANAVTGTTGGDLTVGTVLQQAAGGGLAITTTGGNVTISNTVTSQGSGLTAIEAKGSGKTLTVNQAVTANAGAISLKANGLVNLDDNGTTTDGTVTVAGAYDITVESVAANVRQGSQVASSGGTVTLKALTDVAMVDGMLLQSLGANGAAVLQAGGKVEVSTVRADKSITVSAGTTITDVLTGNAANLDGETATVLLTAATGIGTSLSALQTRVQALGASTTSGGIYLREATALRLARSGSSFAIDAGGGAVVIVTADGSLTVENAVRTTGASGHILLQSGEAVEGTDAALQVRASISTTNGSISLLSADGIAVDDLVAGTAPTVTVGGSSQTLDVRADAGIAMEAAARFATAGGTARLAAQAGSVALGVVDAGAGTVSITASDSITDAAADDGASPGANVLAGSARLAAGADIGAAGALLDTQVASLAAAATGAIFLAEKDALAVAAVAAAGANRVQADGTTVAAADSGTLTGLQAGGVLVLQAGGDLAINQGVSAAGNLGVTTGGKLDVAAATTVLSSGASASLVATGTVTLAAGAVLGALGGTLDLESTGGAVTMADGAIARTDAAALRVKGQGTVTVGLLDARSAADRGTGLLTGQASWGDVSVVSAAAIADNAGETAVDVYARGLRLQAGTGIGAGTEQLETEAATLSAVAGSAGLFLAESTALVLGPTAAIGVNRVSAAGGNGTAQADAPQVGVSSAGALVVQTQAGNLSTVGAVAATGTGNIRLAAGGATADLTLGAALTAAGGNVSLAAGQDLLLNANIAATGAGTLDLLAQRAVTQAQGTSASTAGGNIGIEAVTGNATLETVDAGAGGIWIQAASILDGDAAGDAESDLVGASAQLRATGVSGAIGAAGAALETSVTTLTARAAAGVYLTEANGVTIDSLALDVRRVAADGSSALTAHAAQEDVSAAVVALSATAGNLAINAGTGGTSGIAGGAGAVRLEAVAGTVALAAAVDGGTGSVSVLGAAGVTFTSGASITTSGAGTVDVESGAGAIAMADGAVVATAGGNIRVAAGTDVSVGLLDARTAAGRAGPGATADQASWGAVSVRAGGSITDNPGETTVDVYARALRLQAGSAAGIGSGTEHLETEVAVLSASAAAGSVFVDEGTALAIGAVGAVAVDRLGADGSTPGTASDAAQSGLQAGGAAVVTTAAGSLAVQNAVSVGGNLLLQAAGTANDLAVDAAVTSTGGHASLVASGAIAANAAIATSGLGKTLDLSAGAAITQAQGTQISTTNGALAVVAGGAVTLERLSAGTGDAHVEGSAIVDGDAAPDVSEVDIVAGTLRLRGTTAIGASGATLVTQVGTLSAASAGDVFLVERDDVAVGVQAAVQVQRVGSAGATTTLAPTTVSGLSGATVVLRTVDGSLTTNTGATVSSTGNLLLQAAGTNRDVTLNAATKAGGAVSVSATRDLTVAASLGTTGAGSTIDLQAARIDAQQGSSITTQNGNVQLLATGTVTLESINAGTASVRLSGSAILDGDAAGDTEVDVVAGQLLVTATAGSIGSTTNALETTVATLSASATAGVNLTETDALVLDAVGVSVDRVATTGTTSATPVVSQSGVTGGTTVVVRTLDGSLSSTAAGGVVKATAGHLLLKAAGTGADLTLAGAVTSGASLTLDAARNLQQGADVTATGTADLLAGGTIEQVQGTQLKTSNADVSLAAGGSITIESIASGIGRVSLSGSTIVDGDAGADSEVDITAGGLRATATAGSVGSAANPLETTISTLTVSATGNVFVTETDALDIGGVAVTVNRVGANAATTPVTATAQSGLAGAALVVRAGGALTTLAGTGAVTADGNLLLASGSLTDLALNAAVTSKAGSLSLSAGQDLLLGGNVAAQAAGQTVDLLAQRHVTQGQGTSVTTANGAIALQAVTGDATLELLSAGTGGVRVAAANIVDGDASGDTEADIVGGDVQLLATGGIGATGRLETDVARLSAKAGGTAFLDEANALLVGTVQVNVGRVGTDGTTTLTANAAQSGLSAATLVLRTTGALEVESGSTVASTGNLLLQANGSAGDLTVGGAVGSGGVLSLEAGRNLSLASSLTTTGTAIDIVAAGTLTTQQGSAVTSGGGNVLLQAGAVLTLESVDAGAGTVRLAGSAIVDGDAGVAETEVDVIASALQIAATQGVGTAANPLETRVGTLAVSAGGGIAVSEADALVVDSVTFSGSRTSAAGTAGATGPFTLSDIATSGGDIALLAQGNIDLPANADIRTTGAGKIDITSVTGTVLMQAANPGQSQVQTGSGAIHVVAKGDIRPGALLTTGRATLDSIDGSILVAGDLQRNGQDIDLIGDDVAITVPVSSPGATLTIGPLTTGVPIVVGDVPHVVPSLQVDTGELALLQDGFGRIVIGSTLANQVIDLQGGTPLVFRDPLVLDATGAGGLVKITGSLQAESLTIRDSGSGAATGTTLTGATVSTQGDLVIGDELAVSGPSTLHAGTGGSGNLQVTKAISGAGGATDTLTLQAEGGNVSLDGVVGNLDGLTVTQAVNVTFGAAVTVAGDLVVDATGTVTFNGPLTLTNGGRLVVRGGGQVVFANSANLGSGNALLEVSGLQATGGDGSLTGTGLLEVRGTTAATGIHLGSGTVPAGNLQLGDQALRAIGLGFSTVRIGSAGAGAGAVTVGNADVSVTASPLEILGSTIAVNAGGTGLKVGGNATLHAVGALDVAGSVAATRAGDLVLTSDTARIGMAAGSSVRSAGGQIELTAATGMALGTVDARGVGGAASIVRITSAAGTVTDANADTAVNVYGRAVDFLADGPAVGAGNAIEVSAPLVHVEPSTGTVVRESGADGRTYFNVLRGGQLIQALVAVGPTARVTTDPAAVIANPTQLQRVMDSLPSEQSLLLLSQQYQALALAGSFAVPSSASVAAASASSFQLPAQQASSYLATGVSMVAPDLSFSQRLLADTGLAFASGQPSGESSTVDWWSESLAV